MLFVFMIGTVVTNKVKVKRICFTFKRLHDLQRFYCQGPTPDLRFRGECLGFGAMDMEQLRRDLETVTGARAPSSGESLASVLARLDQLSQSPEMPPRLQHYVSRRSYVKALAWLDDPSTPHEA